MPLSPRELQKPYLPARSSDTSWIGSMSRIEASFFHGRLDEMQQWLDEGVLGRLLSREQRSKIAYPDLLPRQLLAGAAHRLLQPPLAEPALTPEKLTQWWESMTHLRTKACPSPVSDWLYHACVLPHGMADDWVGRGASPHALARDSRGQASSPCLKLLRSVLPMRTHTHGTKGWPTLAARRSLLSSRLDDWIRRPGMTPQQANQGMLTLVQHAFHTLHANTASASYLAWLEGLRDTLVLHGAGCANQLMREVVLPAIAPARVEHAWPGALHDLTTQRNQREQARESSEHQARLRPWIALLAGLPCDEPAPWTSSPDTLSQLLAMDAGHEVLRVLFEKSPAAWAGVQAGETTFFHPRSKVQETPPRAARRIHNLSNLVGLEGGPSREWRQEIACECIRRHSGLSVHEVEAWLDCVQEAALQQEVADTWLRSVTHMSPQVSGVVDNAKACLQMLHARSLIGSLLCQPGVREGSAEDLDHFARQGWQRWLREERFATVLRQLPEPHAARAARMQLFFVDEAVSPEKLDVLLSAGAAQAPHLIAPALLHHMGRLSDDSAARRLPHLLGVVQAMAAAGTSVPVEDVPLLWQEFALRLAPRYRVSPLDPALVEDLAGALNALAPVSNAAGEPMRQWRQEEQVQSDKGYAKQDPSIATRWQALGPLLEKLESWGADFSGQAVASDLPFGQMLGAMGARRQLDADTPSSLSRPRRRF